MHVSGSEPFLNARLHWNLFFVLTRFDKGSIIGCRGGSRIVIDCQAMKQGGYCLNSTLERAVL